MSLENNKAIVQRSYEEFNKGNLAIIDELFSTDCLYANRNVRGIETTKGAFASFHNAFPDAVFTIEDMVAEGDKVWVRHTFSGTHKGTYIGIPATGKQVKSNGVRGYRLADGKIVEHWGVGNDLALMRQFGAIEV